MEQRRTKRFQLRLPVSVVRAGGERVAFEGHTRNISSSGVLFAAEQTPESGGPIEYIISLQNGGGRKVRLKCVGKVLRTEHMAAERAFQVAATLERYEFMREN